MSQFPPPSPDQTVPAQPVGVAGPATSSGGRRRVTLLVIIVSALVLMPVAAVVTWASLRGDGDSSDPASVAEWPLDPQLQRSVEIDVADGSSPSLLQVGGTADDLYVAQDGDEAATVTRYVGGDVRWETQVGLGNVSRVDVWDDKVLVMTQGDEYDSDGVVVRIDPDDGSVMWSITEPGPLGVDRDDGDRLYIDQYGGYEPTTGELAVYDIDTGKEKNRVRGAKYAFANGGFLQVDAEKWTVEFLDADLEPVDGPVDIEGTGDSPYAWAVRQYPGGVMYLAGPTDDGDGRRVIGKAWDGDVLFECDVTVAEPNSILLHDEAIVVGSGDEMEVIDLDGSTCEQRWSVQGGPDSFVSEYGEYPQVSVYDRQGDYIDYLNDDSTVEVLDWDTGEVIATGEASVSTDGKGKMATVDGDAIAARPIDGGDDLWRIEVTKPVDFWIVNGMVVVMTPHDGSATFDIYADAKS